MRQAIAWTNAGPVHWLTDAYMRHYGGGGGGGGGGGDLKGVRGW